MTTVKMSLEDRLARCLALEKAYVYDVYERTLDNCERLSPVPLIQQFLQDLEPGSVVCDVGCGNGKYLSVNSTAVYAVGGERSKKMGHLARGSNREVVFLDNLALPYRDGCLDAVLSIAVIHHLTTKERRVCALRELARVLRVGGRAIISVWTVEHHQYTTTTSQDVLVPLKLKNLNNSSAPADKCQIPSIVVSPFDSNHLFPSHSLSSSDCKKSKCNVPVHITNNTTPMQTTSTSSHPNLKPHSFLQKALEKLSSKRLWFADMLTNCKLKLSDCVFSRNCNTDNVDNIVANGDPLPIELRGLDFDFLDVDDDLNRNEDVDPPTHTILGRISASSSYISHLISGKSNHLLNHHLHHDQTTITAQLPLENCSMNRGQTWRNRFRTKLKESSDSLERFTRTLSKQHFVQDMAATTQSIDRGDPNENRGTDWCRYNNSSWQNYYSAMNHAGEEEVMEGSGGDSTPDSDESFASVIFLPKATAMSPKQAVANRSGSITPLAVTTVSAGSSPRYSLGLHPSDAMTTTTLFKRHDLTVRNVDYSLTVLPMELFNPLTDDTDSDSSGSESPASTVSCGAIDHLLYSSASPTDLRCLLSPLDFDCALSPTTADSDLNLLLYSTNSNTMTNMCCFDANYAVNGKTDDHHDNLYYSTWGIGVGPDDAFFKLPSDDMERILQQSTSDVLRQTMCTDSSYGWRHELASRTLSFPYLHSSQSSASASATAASAAASTAASASAFSSSLFTNCYTKDVQRLAVTSQQSNLLLRVPSTNLLDLGSVDCSSSFKVDNNCVQGAQCRTQLCDHLMYTSSLREENVSNEATPSTFPNASLPEIFINDGEQHYNLTADFREQQQSLEDVLHVMDVDADGAGGGGSTGGGGGEIIYHKYYHVFKEGELDGLIEKYVENLHIISSHSDPSGWCIVAEKVHVWTI